MSNLSPLGLIALELFKHDLENPGMPLIPNGIDKYIEAAKLHVEDYEREEILERMKYDENVRPCLKGSPLKVAEDLHGRIEHIALEILKSYISAGFTPDRIKSDMYDECFAIAEKFLDISEKRKND